MPKTKIRHTDIAREAGASVATVDRVLNSRPGVSKHTAKRILDAVGDHATLTVGETADFASNGGIIRFITRDRQIRLEVNRCAAERAGLQISALLLQMAELTPGACGVPGS